MPVRRRRRPLQLGGVIALPSPSRVHDDLEGAKEADVYALDRSCPIPGGKPGEPDDGVAAWRQRVEDYLSALIDRTDAMSIRIKTLERERELLRARFGGIVWAFTFIFGGLFMGVAGFWNELKGVFAR